MLALRVREHVVRLATGGGCFLGASLSCTDLLVHLYTQVLRCAPTRTSDPDRDYLLLSKGHDVPALYGVLAELGYFAKERLARHLTHADHVYWHPNRQVPGIEFHSGSLGHLLSVGLGIALDMRLRRQASRVFVILGDGELDEGSVWEACLAAGAHGLDNLTAIVDRNGFQANCATEELIPLEPLADKFAAFGCAVRRRRPRPRRSRRGASPAARWRRARAVRAHRRHRPRQGPALARGTRRPLVLRLHGRRGRGAARRAARHAAARLTSAGAGGAMTATRCRTTNLYERPPRCERSPTSGSSS